MSVTTVIITIVIILFLSFSIGYFIDKYRKLKKEKSITKKSRIRKLYKDKKKFFVTKKEAQKVKSIASLIKITEKVFLLKSKFTVEEKDRLLHKLDYDRAGLIELIKFRKIVDRRIIFELLTNILANSSEDPEKILKRILKNARTGTPNWLFGSELPPVILSSKSKYY